MAKAVLKNRRVVPASQCPVASAGVQIADLWAAHNATEPHAPSEFERHIGLGIARQIENAGIHREIKHWRETLETVVSFEKATSLAGALVHTVLAAEVAKDLVNAIDPEPNERLLASKLYRMLASVADVLRRDLDGEFERMRPFWNVYVEDGIQNDIGFRAEFADRIPALVAAGRAANKARSARVRT